MPFVYSEQAVDTISNLITPQRLTRYLIASKGNKFLAIQLYEYNTIIAESLHGLIQPLEIGLRNSIHNVLSSDLRKEEWFGSIGLQTTEVQSVEEAREALRKWKIPITPGRIVAELTFGFWVRLLSRKYEKSLWVPHLHKSFPEVKKPDRVIIFDRFDGIRNLRNRVAHHEPLLMRNLDNDYADIIEALEWICPATAAWIRSTNSLQRNIFRHKPKANQVSA